MIPDLSQTAVVIVVWAMHGCGPCGEYLPKVVAECSAPPFVVWQPGVMLSRGQIPVLLCDAATEDPELSAFADKLGIKSTPTTCIMTRKDTTKIEGAIDKPDLQRALAWAQRQNR